MRWTALREYLGLAALSGTSGSGMALLVPLYMNHQGYSVGLIGLVAALGGVATLLSRVPVPAVYRPQRAPAVMVLLSAIGAASAACLPFLPGLVPFTAVLFVNRAVAGTATAIYLAYFLDTIPEGQDRRKIMGYYGGTQAVGYTAAGLFTGLLADFLGYPEAFFYLASLSGLAGLLLLKPRTLTAQKSRARPASAPSARPTGVRGWLDSVADPGLWGVLNASTWNNFFHTVQVSFFPVLGVAVGLSPAQIGIIRSVYSGINALGRPVAGIVMSRFTLRQISYAGLGAQAALLFLLPFIREFVLFVLFCLLSGTGRAVVVVASSAGLAEEVDESRVSRGVSTAAYSTASDLPNSIGPLIAGFVATTVGVAGMFPIMAVGILASFVGGDLAVVRWRGRRKAAAEQTAPGEAVLHRVD